MQKLSFINSLGKSIDFTSGNLGITNWEGLASVDLNIQTQQVPLTDGSVFIDSLINDRELNFTLAMNDEQDLSKRYTMRRNLVSILNPKLGEGELHYINDYIHVKIKCVPHVPIFENHNSNDSGTPKAGLTFTACNPYWEDINTQEFYINNGETINIENTGDTEVNLHAIFLTGNVKNPSLKNFTTGKEIKLTGTFNNSILIDTNFGSKGVSQDVYSLISDNLTRDADFWQVISFKNKIFCEYEPVASQSDNYRILFSINENNEVHSLNIQSSFKIKFKVVNDVLYLISRNGLTWYSLDGNIFTQINTPVLDICYFDNKYHWIGLQDYSSSNYNLWNSENADLTNATQLSDFISSHFFNIESDGTYIYLFGDNLCSYSGVDWVTWLQINNFSSLSRDYYFLKYKVAKINDKIYITDDNLKLCCLYNATFSVLNAPIDVQFILADDVNNLLYLTNDSGESYLFDGESYTEFTPSLWDGRISHFAYINQNKYYFVYNNSEMKIYNSTDGIQFFNSNMIFYNTAILNGVVSNGKIYIGNGIGYYKSFDGFNWTKYNYNNTWMGLALIKDYIVILKNGNRLIATTDGTIFSEVEVPSIERYWNTVLGNNDVIFTVSYSSGKIAVSYDLRNFEIWETPATGIYEGIVNGDLFVLFGISVNDNPALFFGKNNSWSTVEFSFSDIGSIRNIIYFNEKYIFVYATEGHLRAKYSSDLLNWYDCQQLDIRSNISLNSSLFIHSNTLFLSEFTTGLIYKSSDGVTWEKWSSSLGGNFGFTSNEGKLIIPGLAGTLHLEKTGEINVINNLTEQSDMSFNFVEGNNAVMFSYDEGYATAKVEFNNRYIGV